MATALKRGFEEDDSQSSEAATERHPKRYCSEPAQTLLRDSSEVASSPSVSVYNQINCPWCSKSFEAPEEGATTTHSVLKEHIAHVHPRIASISGDVASVKGTDTEGTMPDHNVAAVTGSVTEVDVTPVGSETPDVMSLNVDATALLNNKLYDLERQQEHAHNTEKHLMACWNVHDARKFSIDYDRAAADVEEMWHHAFDDSKITSKKATKSKKPKTLAPYLSTTTEKGKFLEVTPVEEFLDLLDKFESMPTDQLQAASQSVYHALKTWQDEWIAIEELSRRLGNKSKRPTGPRALDPPDVFRDKKEAMLYGYKYDHSIHDPKKREVNSETTFKCQDAFVQGGFRPTPAQLRKMQAEAGKNNTNPDGFKKMKRYGQEYYPRFQDPPLYPFESRGVSAKKRKLPQGEVAALRQPSVHDSTTTALDSDQDGRPFKRLTRFVIGKAVETSQIQTAPPSPGPRARTGKKRGRVAKTASTSRMTVEQVVPEIVEKPVKEAETVKPPHLVASPTVNDFHAESGTEQAEVTPAPMPALAPAAPGAPPALASLPSNILEPGEALTEEELRRREKIAKSKNPRRTIAMLDHWSKFHGDGRVRNPKRTKEQMEADRLAEEQRKIIVQGKPLVKRRRRKAANGSSDNIAVAQEKKDPSTDTAGMTLQPVSIKPAAVVSSAIPPPAPPVKIVPQTYPLVRPIDSEPRLSSRGFPVLHPEPVSVHHSQNQSALSANGSQPILPSVYAGPAPHSAWNAPSPYFPYGPQLLPRSYHQYGQQQYSHPPPPSHQPAYQVPLAHQPAPHTQPAHHVPGHNRNIQPGLSYPYDSTRPAPHTQNGAQVPRS